MIKILALKIHLKKTKQMKPIKYFLIVIAFTSIGSTNAQKKHIEATPENWTVYNREVDFNNNIIHLNANDNDGVLWLNGTDFKNGIIELDIKGKDTRGQSFVGVAFHGLDNDSFDAIYFRPFNFKNPERKSHSVQYIDMPKNEWSTLRNKFPGKYENTVNPVPDPNDWFYAKIVINFPEIKVYINNSEEPSLVVNQISERKNGKIGLWVGNGSEGWFKNFILTSK